MATHASWVFDDRWVCGLQHECGAKQAELVDIQSRYCLEANQHLQQFNSLADEHERFKLKSDRLCTVYSTQVKLLASRCVLQP